jgi:acyl dehydratase
MMADRQRFLEDFTPGEADIFGDYDVTRADVIAFAEKFDPQPFHLSDQAAAATHFGRIAASGWHSCAMAMRMLVDRWQQRGVETLGSPGVDELRWLKPVFPGDRLHTETLVEEVRPSRSRPEIGTIHSLVVVYNQADEAVLRFRATVLLPRRPA